MSVRNRSEMPRFSATRPAAESGPAATAARASAPVTRADEAGIATLTLARPDTRNALSEGMLRALLAHLEEIAEDQAVRVVILAAEGPVFCAGHDLREMRADPRREIHERLFRLCSRVMMTLQALPQPVIAQVQGMATAAGCQLVATADLAVASEAARFATPGVNIGLFCSTPMVALSRAVGRKPAMEMLLTGEPVTADRARELGLINRVVPADRLAAETRRLAEIIAAKSTMTVALGKEAFYRQAEMPLREAYEHTGAVMVRNMMAADATEGIDAFLEKRAPEWRDR